MYVCPDTIRRPRVCHTHAVPDLYRITYGNCIKQPYGLWPCGFMALWPYEHAQKNSPCYIIMIHSQWHIQRGCSGCSELGTPLALTKYSILVETQISIEFPWLLSIIDFDL